MPHHSISVRAPADRSIECLHGELLQWYDVHQRELPWRGGVSPYATWVSEIMLQQTQVKTVIPYFQKFLESFPTFEALAQADEERVLAHWTGLGYYRRARSLHAGAQFLVAEGHTELPNTLEELLALPGVGRYTAGAIASIAFGVAAPVLDGNVRRVLSRLFAFDASGLTPREEEKQLWQFAELLVHPSKPGDWNQALMELGARICSPSQPQCESCPVQQSCKAFALDRVAELPITRPKAKTQRVDVAVFWLQSASGELLLERPSKANPLRGYWELPAVELPAVRRGQTLDGSTLSDLQALVAKRFGLRVVLQDAGARATHGILDRRLKLHLLLGETATAKPGPGDSRPGGMSKTDETRSAGVRWVQAKQLPDEAVSGATIKAWKTIRKHFDHLDPPDST